MPTPTEDRDAIRELFARYCLHIDVGTPEDWASCFTPDGTFSGLGEPLVGREALVDFAAGRTGRRAGVHHLVMNEVIDLDGDTAHCRSSILVARGGVVTTAGRYADELRRVDGSWRIATRHFTPDPPAAS